MSSTFGRIRRRAYRIHLRDRRMLRIQGRPRAGRRHV